MDNRRARFLGEASVCEKLCGPELVIGTARERLSLELAFLLVLTLLFSGQGGKSLSFPLSLSVKGSARTEPAAASPLES